MAPRPNTSLRGSILPNAPTACSGGMNAGVPIACPAWVKTPSRRLRTRVSAVVAHGSDSAPSRSRLASTLASPQSMTWTSPNAPTITFDGFRSRWITP